MQKTTWLSPTDYVTGDRSLRISYPSVSHPSTIVTSNTIGDLEWITMSLRLPEDITIEEVIICYQVSNARSFISQVRISEMGTPDQALVRHDDPTDLQSTTPARYRSIVGGVVPTSGAAVTLELRLNFQNTSDKIFLGAVGVQVRLPTRRVCVHVKDHGAKGDGVTCDTAAIQSAIGAAATLKLPLVFDALTYVIKSELCIDKGNFEMIGSYIGGDVASGHGNDCTTIKAAPNTAWTPPSVGMRACLVINSSYCRISGIIFDAGKKSQHGVYFDATGYNELRNVCAFNAIVDGFHLSTGGNYSNHFVNCFSTDNGQIFVSSICPEGLGVIQVEVGGTVDTDVGSNVLTFSNSTDMSKIAHLRWGDYICVGVGISVGDADPFGKPASQYFQVTDNGVDVTRKQITVGHHSATATVRGASFWIAHGSGYWEAGGNTNNNHITGGLWRRNAGSGMHFAGLYGPLVENPQLDYNVFYGCVCGSGGITAARQYSFLRVYVESSRVADFLITGVEDVLILCPIGDGGGLGVLLDYGGSSGCLLKHNLLSPIGSTTCDIPVAVLCADTEFALKQEKLRLSVAGSPPSTGTWRAGDRIYNSAPTPGGTEGWVCTNAGTFGIGAGLPVFKTFGAIDQ